MGFSRRIIFLYSAFILLFGMITPGRAQNKYRVYFCDKGTGDFNPLQYFDIKAIERRVSQDLPLFDETDKPVYSDYVKAVQSLSDSIGKTSRWFNFVVAYCSPEKSHQIGALTFVSEVECAENMTSFLCATPVFKSNLNNVDTTILINQLKRMKGEEFTKAGMNGNLMRIAVFDAGFTSVDKNPAFEHLRSNFKILKTWDFVKNHEYVYAHNTHGTEVLSCIGGKIGAQKIGLATEAEFILARTERGKTEFYSEEENWLAAAEWADKNGADIINSSLGYTYQRYFTGDMDGKKSLVTRAANLAAKKGMLVVNSAGNEGSDKWRTIGAPADADSALSIGGIDPDTNYHIDFSSFGPTADKRPKPNLCSYGDVVAASPKGLERATGTSFSSPLIAGFAACAWQSNRKLSCMELFHQLEQSGDLYPYFDYAHGYGVPQASYFMEIKKEEKPITFDIIEKGDSLSISIRKEFLEVEAEKNTGFKNYLYYKIENPEGKIDEYFVVKVYQREVLTIPKSKYNSGKNLKVFYKGYSSTYKFI